MSTILRGCDERGELIEVVCRAWDNLLDLAIAHGWEPMGTFHLEDDDWNGVYRTSDYQSVRPDDLVNLAAALERGEQSLAEPSDAEHLHTCINLFKSTASRHGAVTIA